MDGPSQYIRAVREADSVNVSDVSALFIPHILVEEPHHPDNVRFRASISHRKGMARGVAMKGGIDGIKGPGFPRNARIITRFSQVWHKGVAKGSSYRIGKWSRLSTDCSLSKRDDK